MWPVANHVTKSRLRKHFVGGIVLSNNMLSERSVTLATISHT